MREVAWPGYFSYRSGMFFRWRTIRGKQYLYAEERWREGGKVRSRSTLVGGGKRRRYPSVGQVLATLIGGGAGIGGYELHKAFSKGSKKEPSGKHKQRFQVAHDPRRAWSDKDWEARVSLMSRQEFERYLAHAKAAIASGKFASNKEAMEAARYTHAKAVEERYWAAVEKGENPGITIDDEEA